MLDLDHVDKIATKAASAILGQAAVDRVLSEPKTGSEGEDALRITLVLTKQGETALNGDLVIDTMFRMARDLSEAGEQRAPIVGFTTEEELASSDDLES